MQFLKCFVEYFGLWLSLCLLSVLVRQGLRQISPEGTLFRRSTVTSWASIHNCNEVPILNEGMNIDIRKVICPEEATYPLLFQHSNQIHLVS